MIALLAGATGLVGGECLRRLLAEPRYAKVFAPTRRPLPEHPKLVQLPAEFDAELPAELAGGDVFCCLGTTIRKAGSQDAFRRVDHGIILALARRALGSGARQFLLVSSIGADPASGVFYSRVKGEVERDVAALPFRSVAILRPSLLLGARAESRPGEALAQAAAPLLSLLLAGPLKGYRPIEAAVVARALLRAALEAVPGVRVLESAAIREKGGPPSSPG